MPQVITFTADLKKNFVTVCSFYYCLGIPLHLGLVNEFKKHFDKILMNDYVYAREVVAIFDSPCFRVKGK